jgi:RND family efflux transporter MFP subunit
MPLADSHDQETGLADDKASLTSFSSGTARRLSFIAAAVAIALGCGFLFVHHKNATTEANLASATRQEMTERPRVDVVTVTSPTATQPLMLPGETAAWYESTIYARVSGYVDKWFVDIGDQVKAGQTLATIDTPELDAELLAAKAKLKASEAQVAVKQAQANFAKTTYDRWRGSPKGVVSEQEREDKKANSTEAAAELNAAQAQVGLAQADVDRLSAFEQFKQVTAPFDGTIIQRRIDIGNLVTAGSTASTTPLYRITQDDPMRVFVDAPQRVAPELMKSGELVTITGNDLRNQRFEGKVARTAKAINPTARTLRVEIDLPNPDHALVPGMYVQVSFELKNSGLVQVPAAALLFRSKGPQIAVIDENGVVSIKDVTIARDDGNVVEIGSGLTIGDKVVLNLSTQIVDGEKVKINEIDQGNTGRVAASAH